MLHMWMLIHRLSADGDTTRALRQELYDLFQEDVEVRVRQQIEVRVAATVTDLEKSFYGTALALDRVRPPGHTPPPPPCVPLQAPCECLTPERLKQAAIGPPWRRFQSRACTALRSMPVRGQECA